MELKTSKSMIMEHQLQFILFLLPITSALVSNKAYIDEYNTQYLPQNDQTYDPNYQQILEEASQIRKQSLGKPDPIDVRAELDKLNTSYTWDSGWPRNSAHVGEVSAVAIDVDGNVVVLHRAERVWNQETFKSNNVYRERSLGPITSDIIVAFDRKTGKGLYEFGRNVFYMPHGLTIDLENNYWLTDVALHQVMKYTSKSTLKKPEIVLGTAFVPGNTRKLFCKPTSVAVLPNGDFFVADGYCNSRIIKFSKKGEFLLVWGHNSFQGRPFDAAPPNYFAIPHALTLALDMGLVCVADRENGRVQCFHIGNGTFHSQYHSPIIGDRLFSVAYTPIRGGQLIVINGPTLPIFNKPEHFNEALGFVIDMKTKQVISKFSPNNKPFNSSHDLVVTPDGTEVYVAELVPRSIYKFVTTDLSLYNSSESNIKSMATYNDDLSPHRTKALANDVDARATALLVVAFFVIVSIVGFGVAVLLSKRRKRGCLQIGTKNNRRHAWDFPTVKSDSFKLGNLLDRKRGFEKLNQEASDEEPNASTTMLSNNNNNNAQFA